MRTMEYFKMRSNIRHSPFNILGLQWRNQNFELTTFLQNFLHNVNNPILYGEYEPQESVLCEFWLGLWLDFYGFKIVQIRLFHRISVL